MLIFDHIKDALESLRSTRARTLLTTLGITIGVASMTAILSLSGGIVTIISRQVTTLNGNIALVHPRLPGATSQAGLVAPVAMLSFGTSTLTEDDAGSIAKLPGVEMTAPLMVISGSLKNAGTTIQNGLVLATSPSLQTISDLRVADGQFIDTVTNPNTAVIGPRLAVNLFGTEHPIGQSFAIRGQTFTIIGILKAMKDPINFNGVDFDNAAIISLEAGKAFNGGHSQIQQISLQAHNASDIPDISRRVREELAKRHGGEEDFVVVSGEEIVRPNNRLFTAIAGVMTAIAAISLIVGGVGIMNIMLVGVAERTREIGLRKAVGASNRNILGQFLTESLLISLGGGFAGYILGYAAAFAVGRFFMFTPGFTWLIAALAFGTSMVIGLIFGLYPAIRAARKDPIRSLRNYG